MAINPFNIFNSQKRSQILPSGDVSSFVISGNSLVPNNLVNAEYALKNSDVFAVINRIASDVSACDFNSDDESVQSILNKPSGMINSFNFWQTVVAQMLLTGNCYVAIWREKNSITRLEKMNQVEVELGDNAKNISYKVTFEDERPDMRFASNEMLHFKLLSVGSNNLQYVGRSPLESLAMELSLQDYSKKLTLGTLKNAINPSVTLTVPEGILDADKKDNIRKAFEQQTTGTNQGKAIVLDQGLKVDALNINTDVAKYLSNTDVGKTQIAKAFGVPDSILNGQGDQQSSIEMTRSFYANSLQVYIKPIESELTLKLNSKVNLDEASAIDVDKQALIENLTKLATGKTPVLEPELVKQILREKGVIKY